MNSSSLRTRSWGCFVWAGASDEMALVHFLRVYRRRCAMIVVMKVGSTKQQIEHVIKLVREMGLKEHVIEGTERTVVAVIGNDRFKDRTVVESVEGVDKVVPILAPYKMASKEVKKERSLVPMLANGQAKVGGRKVQVIAGPCSVESKQQLLETARAVKEMGATALRGGAFKPRT